jgi:hypothetical protein
MYSVNKFLRCLDGTVFSEKGITVGIYLKYVKQVTIHFLTQHRQNPLELKHAYCQFQRVGEFK